MLVWLLKNFPEFFEGMSGVSTGDSRVSDSSDCDVHPGVFRDRRRLWTTRDSLAEARFRERIVSASDKLNELHAGKRDTPTMGGLFIVLAIVVAAISCGDLANWYLLQSLLVVVGFGAVGAQDDWIKVSSTARGLTTRNSPCNGHWLSFWRRCCIL